MRLAIIFLAAATATAAAQDAFPQLPDPTLTPGAVDARVTLSAICNKTTRGRRHVSAVVRERVFAAYGVAPADEGLYELDHLIPLAIGGSNDAANLWPQPELEAERKDRLEIEMQRLACAGYRTLVPEEAEKVLSGLQAEIANDWTDAFRKYVKH